MSEILGRPLQENCAPQNFGAIRYYTVTEHFYGIWNGLIGE